MKPRKRLVLLSLLRKNVGETLLTFSVFIFLYPLGVNEFFNAQFMQVKKTILTLPSFQLDQSTNLILASIGFVLMFVLVVIHVIVNKRLNKMRLDLSKLNTNLEFQVQERTAALSQINHDLELEIAERKRVEKQLHESEEKFRSLLDSQEGNIMVIDFEGVHHYVNLVSVGSITGSGTTQDIIGKRLHDLYPTRIANWQLEQVRRVFTTGLGMSGDFREHVGNRTSWWHLNLQPIRNAVGNVVQVMVNSLNITDRKQVEDALRESESRFRSYFELPLGGRAITSPNKSWLNVNSGLCDMLGYAKDELMQMTWDELTHPEDIAVDMEQFNRVMAGEIDGYTIEKRFIHKEGRSIYTHMAVQCLRHPDRSVDYFVALLLDITKLKQVEEEIKLLNSTLEQRVEERTIDLIHANHVKDEFLAMISHELRTPLISILGFSETLIEGLRGPLNERQEHAIQMIQSGGEHLLAVINDILDISKIQTERLEFFPENVDVYEICISSLEFIKPFAEKKSIKMELTHPGGLNLFVDKKHLKQILLNLLNNAIKFTPQYGRVTLEVQVDAKTRVMRFSVMDSGIGISAENLSRLFQPFVQLDSKLSRQYEGTGLGLVLVKKMVEMHGGSIEVQSEVGTGSCFTAILPWEPKNEKD